MRTIAPLPGVGPPGVVLDSSAYSFPCENASPSTCSSPVARSRRLWPFRLQTLSFGRGAVLRPEDAEVGDHEGRVPMVAMMRPVVTVAVVPAVAVVTVTMIVALVPAAR